MFNNLFSVLLSTAAITLVACSPSPAASTAASPAASTALSRPSSPVFAKTFDAYVPNNVPAFFNRSRFTPTDVPFADVDRILKKLDVEFKESYAFAKRVTAPTLFNHARRTTYFATSLLWNGFPSKTPGIPQVTFEELTRIIYLTSMMHDVALTYDERVLAHPAHNMSFEFYGGIMVYEHLNEAYHPGPRSSKNLSTGDLGNIVQGIFLHTTLASSGNSSASSFLNVLGSSLDIIGYDSFGPGEFSLRPLWTRKLVGEIEAAAPRTGLGKDIIKLYIERELGTKPTCILGQRGPEALFEAAKRKSILDD